MSYEQTIYNRLRYWGLTQEGAIGILGNWACESGNEPYRLQGDFSPYRTTSHAYVQGITNGTITKQQMQNDQKGIGLAQWTYWSRKAALYDFWKASGKAFDSAEMQTDYAIKEMKEGYPQLLAFLKETTDIFTACSRVCREFERPAANNIDARYAAAKRIQYEINLDGGGEDPDPQPTVDHSLQLRTVDRNCEGFNEILLLKGLLLCRNFDFEKISEDLWAVVKQFQAENGLMADGIVGPKTWASLLERR